MKVRTALSAALAATIAATAAPLFAASSADSAKPNLRQLDANGDGQISRDEAQKSPKLSSSFDRLDTNKDGQLSRDELRAGRAQHDGSKRASLDANHDGQISRDEAKTAPRLTQNFDAIDTNKDGQLSREEMAAWHKAHPRSQGSPSAQPAQPVKP